MSKKKKKAKKADADGVPDKDDVVSVVITLRTQLLRDVMRCANNVAMNLDTWVETALHGAVNEELLDVDEDDVSEDA